MKDSEIDFEDNHHIPIGKNFDMFVLSFPNRHCSHYITKIPTSGVGILRSHPERFPSRQADGAAEFFLFFRAQHVFRHGQQHVFFLQEMIRQDGTGLKRVGTRSNPPYACPVSHPLV